MSHGRTVNQEHPQDALGNSLASASTHICFACSFIVDVDRGLVNSKRRSLVCGDDSSVRSVAREEGLDGCIDIRQALRV